ncbi:hypothetical protein [Serratia inhibens]|uniref:hypothetical protein n=1 Tax=Serratia inhibens TaxID=2338073 RepID=UPI0032168049
MKQETVEVRLSSNNTLKVVKPHETADDYGHGGGGGTGGGDMLQRIKDLEKDMHGIKTDIAVMKSNYATRADVSDAKFSIIVWVVSAIFIAQLLPIIIGAIKTAFQ